MADCVCAEISDIQNSGIWEFTGSNKLQDAPLKNRPAVSTVKSRCSLIRPWWSACPVQAVSIRWHLQQTLIDLPAPGFVWLRLSQSGSAARRGSEVELTPVSRLRVRGSNIWGHRSHPRLLFAAVTRISRWDGFRSDEQSSRAPRTRGNRSLAQFSPTVSNYSWGGPIHQAWHLLDSIIPTLPVWLRAPHVRLRHKLREKKLKNYNKNRSDCLL